MSKNGVKAISYNLAEKYGCPSCNLTFFPGSDKNISRDGYFSEICYDDDETNMDASGGCGEHYYVYLPGRESSLPKDALILEDHPRPNPAHNDGQRCKNDPHCNQR